MVKLFDRLCSLLASERLDPVVLWGYHLLTHLGRLSEDQLENHLRQNRIAWERRSFGCLSPAADGNVYLEHQTGLSGGREGADCVFGVRKKRPLTADYNSCEVIAVYNCLRFFGREVDFPGLLGCFERKGAALGGAFGTDPEAIREYMRRLGFLVEKLGGRDLSQSLDSFGKRHAAFLLCMYNHTHSLENGMHTMCVTKCGDGGFLLHNDYHTYGRIVFASLEEAIASYRDGNARTLLLLGVTPASE
ncbi:MAG: hypothetical protein ACI4FY_06745 [Acetatifactor sp.]